MSKSFRRHDAVAAPLPRPRLTRHHADRAAARERGFARVTISTSWSSALSNIISRSTENPSSLVLRSTETFGRLRPSRAAADRLPATPSRAIKSEVELYFLIFERFDCNHDLEESMNLVFASGFLVPQHLLGINYFRGLEEHLKGKHETLFPDVGPLETSEERASELADAINNKKFPDGPIHIIAHSMGGLDSRSLIGRNLHGLSAPGRIASLTTLSTPHRGSPVADLLVGPKPTGALDLLMFEAVRHALGQLSIPTGALGDLTTEGASRIPDVAKTHPHIRYRSCFAAGRPKPLPTCLILVPTHHYVHSVTGEANDGVVALNSARYGEFQEPFFPCDHVDLVGHNLDPPGFSQFNHFAAIEALIAQL
jgi:triacylglycerol lipase